MSSTPLPAQETSLQTEKAETPAEEPPLPTKEKTQPVKDKTLPAEETATPSTATPEQIETWLKKLDSDVYADRQSAMQNLRRSGVAGVEALAKIARGSNLEVTVRAVNLLSQLYESPDTQVAIAADEALEALGKKGPAVAAVRTQEIFSTTLATLRRRHAIATIKRLGGHVIPKLDFDDEGRQEVEANLDDEDTVQYVVLGRKWTGGLDGVKYLQRIPELRLLYITTDIPLDTDERSALKERLPEFRIDVRGSAYLGVTSVIQDPDLCLIHNVVPNSPAKRAGLQQGDLITHVDGLPIHGFIALTTMLSFKQGGDIVFLEVMRGEEPIEVTVTLGEW